MSDAPERPDPLAPYRRKRDPARTSEPFGPVGEAHGAPVFVVQRHDARRLHYDVRLERAGVLVSWAVPKGPPLELGQRNLAVHVEDHPLDYAAFSGTIPAGEYGGGTVEIWDRGTYELLAEEPDGTLTVRLRGERLAGTWTLRAAGLGGDERNWLMVRRHDEEVGALPPEPERWEPMTPTSRRTPPEGDAWRHEIAWPGPRALCRVRNAVAEVWGDAGAAELAAPLLTALAHDLRTPACVVDGTLYRADAEGRPAAPDADGRVVFCAVDVLEVDGRPLLAEPFATRRATLEALIMERAEAIRTSALFDDGTALLLAAAAQELPGILSSRLAAPYAPGARSTDRVHVATGP